MVTALTIAFLVTPVGVITVNSVRRGRKAPTWLLFVVAGMICYGMLAAADEVIQREHAAEFAHYDLNGNGLLDANERTHEAIAAMQKIGDNTGLAGSPIDAALMSWMWVLVCFAFREIAPDLSSRRDPPTPRL